jgi:PAS domain S-box-containing protein
MAQTGRRVSGAGVLIIGLITWLCAISSFLDAHSALVLAATPAPDQPYLHEVWTTEQGLPQNSVTSLVQTRDGYLWLGTFGGLARFDGIKFTVFDTGNTPELLSNRILCLHQDRDGALWIGTEDGGLTRYARGRFTTYTTKDGLPTNFIARLSEDHQGNLWIRSSGEMVRWTEGHIFRERTIFGFPSQDVIILTAVPDGSLWGVVKNPPRLFRSQQGVVTTYNTIDNIRFDRLSDNLTSIMAGPEGHVYVNTDQALSRFSNDGLTALIKYPSTDQASERTQTARDARGPGTPISLLPTLTLTKQFIPYKDRRGEVRFLTPLGFARLEHGQFITMGRLPALSNGGPSALRVRAVIEDQEGNIWVASIGAGLHRFRLSPVVAYGQEDGLADAEFQIIAGDHEGRLALVAKDERAYRFDRGTFSAWPLNDGGPKIAAVGHGREGTLWLWIERGLARLQEGRLTSFDSPVGFFPPAATTVLYEDREGVLWIGRAGLDNRGRLVRFQDGRFTVYQARDGLASNDVRVIHQDRQGALWIGGTGGLSRLEDGVFTNYTTEQGLSHNYVRAIYEDADSTLWLGTYGGGLDRFKNGVFSHITTRQGLFDNIVSWILEDGQGNFWMSCNRGLYRARRQDLNDLAEGKTASITCTAYGVRDGMKTSECNGGRQPAGWKTPDGRLWFPTLKGVVAVDPGQLNDVPPLVAIEQVRIDQTPLDWQEKLEAPPSQGDLEIHYTGLSFAAPEKVRFKYRLEGYDANWVEAGPRRMAYYTKLPPGRYRFRVLASNNDGVWNDEGAAMELTLAPHFYQTAWFSALCVVGLLLAVWGGVKLRLKRLERRTRELEVKIKERTAEVIEQKDQLACANEQLTAVNEQLAHANQDLLSIFNQWRSGVMTTDADGRVAFLSRTAERLFDQHLRQVAGRPWAEAIPAPEQVKAELQAIARRSPEQRTKLPIYIEKPGGERYWVEIEVQDDPRDPRCKIFFLYDVSAVYNLSRLVGEEARFHDLVGESPPMQMVFRQIRDVALVDSTVLIQGETGTGKELVARAIHQRSARKTRPFIPVNCAGLTESLVASQLFGHKRGSFTGAVADQMGVFEAAQGGTVFLDEIGDIPLSVQTSLLRVLQEKEISRLGDSTPRPVDVRVIAATHRDLNQLVAEGRFRQDLLYRIRVICLQVPALRERRSDVPLLTAWFLNRACTTSDAPIKEVGQETMQSLMNYEWPGNVRELSNAIESAVVRSQGVIIRPEDLPVEVTHQAPPPSQPDDRSSSLPDVSSAAPTVNETRATMPGRPAWGDPRLDRKQQLLDVLQRTGGNRTAAARLLGVGRSTLYRWLQELGLETGEENSDEHE